MCSMMMAHNIPVCVVINELHELLVEHDNLHELLIACTVLQC